MLLVSAIAAALPSSISWNRPTITGAAVAVITPEPEIPATKTLRRPRRGPKNGAHGLVRTRTPAIPSDRVLHQATGRDLPSGGRAVRALSKGPPRKWRPVRAVGGAVDGIPDAKVCN
jgi:hypothetical protein